MSTQTRHAMNSSSNLPFDVPPEFQKKSTNAMPQEIANAFQEANEAYKTFMKNKKEKNKKAALKAIQYLEETAPDLPATQELAGKFYLAASMLDECLESFNRLNLLVPNNVNIIHATAKLYEKLNMHFEAFQFANYAIELRPNDPSLLAYGWMLAAQFDLDKVHTYIQRYVKLKPDCPIGLVSLCTHQLRARKIPEAAKTRELIVKYVPNEPMLLYVDAMLKKESKEYDESVRLFEEYLQTNAPQLEMEATVELAAMYEKVGDVDKAYEGYLKSNMMMKNHPRSKNVSGDYINAMLRVCNKVFSEQEWVDSLPTYQGRDEYQTPLYIVGFPRSGTTLLEQVITTFPEIMSSQEAGLLDSVNLELSRLLNRQVPYPKGMEEVSQDDLKIMRDHYFLRAETAIGESFKSTDKWLLDKQPYSAMLCGLLYQMFPDAKVIFMQRDPRDCILSCFKQSFVPSGMASQFWEFSDTVQNYIKFMELFLTYKDTLPLNFMIVKYEDMVADFETHARALCDFIEKPWDDKILEYYKRKQKRGVRTPSFTGVNQPMYTKAIGKWQPWETYFEPYKDDLMPIMERLGYEW